MLKASKVLRAVRAASTVATVDKIPNFESGARIFSLIQPTGRIHLGNYLGAVRNWKTITEKAPEDVQCIFGTADLHSLTQLLGAKELSENRLNTIASLISAGVDPERCILFHQSSVSGHSELYWILTCLTSMGSLNRMTQWKLKAHVEDKLDIYSEQIMGKTKAGVLLYPVLQAADVLLYNSTHVPVGDDQSQHLELCRGIASTFNHTYGNFFTLPKTILTPTKKILSLRNPEKKMSKSDKDQNSAIYMVDDADTITRKMRKAVTDSVQGPITYDPVNRPGVSNLINIVAGIFNQSAEQTVKDMAWISNHKQLKDYVTEVIVEEFKDKRTTYEQLTNDKAFLSEICDKGTQAASELAHKNLTEIKRLVGLL